jgi:hypothetical protein
VENIAGSLVWKIRWLDKLTDEWARSKVMEKISNSRGGRYPEYVSNLLPNDSLLQLNDSPTVKRFVSKEWVVCRPSTRPCPTMMLWFLFTTMELVLPSYLVSSFCDTVS